MENALNIRRRIITSLVATVLLVLTVFGITFAYFVARIQGNTNTKSIEVTAGKLELTYRDGNGLIELLKIQPGVILSSKVFTVENTGNNPVDDYNVILEEVVNEFKYTSDLTYTLTCTSSSGSCTGSNGTFPQNTSTIATNQIDPGVIHTYSLTVSYNETNTDQSDDMNKEVHAKVNIVDDDEYSAD